MILPDYLTERLDPWPCLFMALSIDDPVIGEAA
jgi:hypothetical protein